MQKNLVGALMVLLSAAVLAGHAPEEVLVTGHADSGAVVVGQTVQAAADTGALLRDVPGASLQSNGPLSGRVQIRGLAGDRVSVMLDGAHVSSGCTNAMDPPLHYAPAVLLESLQVYRGIAPVSVAQESIGGAVTTTAWNGPFASNDGVVSSGRILLGGQDINHGHSASVMTSLADQHHRLRVAGLNEEGDDSEFPGGELLPTEYHRERADLGYGYQRGNHFLSVDAARNDSTNVGTPALPMDVSHIDTDLSQLQYRFTAGDWQLSTRVFRSDVAHGMTNYHLRTAPSDPMQRRRSEASSDSEGWGVSVSHGVPGDRWQVGLDSYQENHNALIDNPWNPMFWVVGFDDAARSVQGLFVEKEWQLPDRWSMDAGIRYNRVRMDADTVDNSMASMMNMMGMLSRNLRDQFNTAHRHQVDHNIDAVWRLYFQQSQALRWYAGLAQKTRSPSFQERYLWMPLEATGGLADGNTYTGNVALDPEIAHQFEAGLDWEGPAFTAAPRVFISRIHDYIQGVPSTDTNAVMLVAMMNMMNGTSNPSPLQYDNVDARLYGFDMPWAWAMADHWRLQGSVSMVRGERRDINDDLYRITPDNMRAGLVYHQQDWSVTLEGVLVDEQEHVSATNREQETAGYALANLKANWQVTEALGLSANIENLFDRQYRDHLGGYNRAVNPDIALGERLPGNGRNVFVAMEYRW